MIVDHGHTLDVSNTLTFVFAQPMNPNIATIEVFCQEDAKELKEGRAGNFQIYEASGSGG